MEGQTARDLVVQATGIITPAGTTADIVGVIGNRVLARLLPPRRPRISTRKVRSSVSRYAERQDDGRPRASSPVTSLDITILEPEPDLPTVSHNDRHIPPANRRRQQVLDLLHADPDRHWRTRDLTRHLGNITLSTMYRQLDRWAAQGLITKTGPATYASPRTHSTPLPPAETR